MIFLLQPLCGLFHASFKKGEKCLKDGLHEMFLFSPCVLISVDSSCLIHIHTFIAALVSLLPLLSLQGPTVTQSAGTQSPGPLCRRPVSAGCNVLRGVSPYPLCPPGAACPSGLMFQSRPDNFIYSRRSSRDASIALICSWI